MYTLPAVAMRVVELTNQPSIDVAALKECIQNDPALTTKILRVVNSSLFGLPSKVADLNQALALIGTNPLKLMVLGFSLPDELLSNLEMDILENYWRHALVKAVAAREISELVWGISGDEAFVAGLLQDVGVLVLIQELGPPYVTFLDQVWSVGGDLAELESSTLGFDHGVLSSRLLEEWGLPKALVKSVSQPFDVERLTQLPDDEQALPQILHLAEIVAGLLSHDRSELLKNLLSVGRSYHDLTIGQVDELIDSLEANVQPLAEILSVPLTRVDYRNILTQAHSQLANAADKATKTICSTRNGPELQVASRALTGALQRLATAPGQPSDSNPDLATQMAEASESTAGVPQVIAVKKSINDPGMIGRITAAIANCRKSRCAISLALVELDDYESLFLTCGLDGVYQVVDQLRLALLDLLGDDGQLVPADDARFAVILENCDRQQGVLLIRHLVQGVRRSSTDDTGNRGCIRSISAGLATLSMPPKNFRTNDLIESAQRCLDGAKSSGGDSVKSIDI
jgi:HD-like signal output (HDOD) protein/GGDEF domain-containing protein